MAVLTGREGGGYGACVAEGSGWVVWERDEGRIESAGYVFEDDFHWGYVGCVALRGPGEDVAANAASGSVEYPGARVAGC